MRNLRNLQHVALEFESESEFSDAAITASAWDGDELICAFGPSPLSHTITLKRFPSDARTPDQAVPIASWDAPPPTPDIQYDRILSLHCLASSGSKCLILEGGDIVLIREDAQPDEDLISIVGSVDAGIAAAAWSPDQEIVVIVTKADTVLFMTQDFEGTASAKLAPDDISVSNHVSVGWGKSETQFKGRGAKALRDPTVPERVDIGILSPLDDGRINISWRGDSQYLALNCILRGTSDRRVIRVFSRDGILDSVSEPVDGLESSLSWKPSGQIIAGVQRVKADEVNVVFFERNGLRHGEFGLRLSSEQCRTAAENIGLQWNADSTVLAVALKDRVQLWTMGNYHYYLKQEICLSQQGSEAVSLVWNTERPLEFSFSSRSSCRLLKYTFWTSRGSVTAPDDAGLTLVIDGQILKITPFRIANVPPPFAFEELQLPSTGLDVAVNQAGTLLAVLHADSVSLWDLGLTSQPRKPSTLKKVVQLAQSEVNKQSIIHRQVSITHGHDIYILSSASNVSESIIHRIDQVDRTEKSRAPDLSTLVESLVGKRLLCEDHRGTIYDITGDGTSHEIERFPQHTAAAHLWQAGDVSIFFGLSTSGVLHIKAARQTLRAQGCTSFLVTTSHLIYTTTQHLLKFVHLGTEADLEIPADEPEKDERCRSVERGAVLVTAMPSAYSLVLQMPRGNLETIYPRALVLAGIRHALDCRKYKKAFSICRTQRVDMNILHDYAPVRFLQDVSQFVEQLKKTEFVDLFLSSLSEEDVTETVYKDTVKQGDKIDLNEKQAGSDHGPASNFSKVNRICDAFLIAFKPQASPRTQNIITAHVCKSPPDLEAGLRVISTLRKGQAQGLGGQEKDQGEVERAVAHICFLADVNQLYDTALGLYDLQVALLIAQQSQKDPREYLPYLQNLQKLPQLRQQFAIDNDLKRFAKALIHLHALDDFEEFKAFMSKHELHAAAIELYRYDSLRLAELMQAFAEFLSQRNRFKESGIAYEYVGDYAAAYESYRAGGLWQECLSCAALMKMDTADMRELAQDLLSGLEESKDFTAAAKISLDYLNDLESALRLWCAGYEFAEAIRQASLHQREELLGQLIDTGLVDASATMTEMLAEMRTQLKAQVPRLRDLRQKKAEDPMSFLNGGGDNNDDTDVPDNISLAPTDTSTSGGTFMTRYTNRSTATLATNATRKTSKNRRREERKRAKGKKGTVYEEEYLVNSIFRLIERLNSVGQDVSKLVDGLMRRAMRERAVAVDSTWREVITACEGCTDEVFGRIPTSRVSEGRNDSQNNPEVDVSSRPLGGQGILWDAINAAQEKPEAPTLKKFERLSLLG